MSNANGTGRGGPSNSPGATGPRRGGIMGPSSSGPSSSYTGLPTPPPSPEPPISNGFTAINRPPSSPPAPLSVPRPSCNPVPLLYACSNPEASSSTISPIREFPSGPPLGQKPKVVPKLSKEALGVKTEDWEALSPGFKKCPYCRSPVRIKSAADHTKWHAMNHFPAQMMAVPSENACGRCRKLGQPCQVWENPSTQRTYKCKTCLCLKERCSHPLTYSATSPKQATSHPALD